jgi:hypothetical protein
VTTTRRPVRDHWTAEASAYYGGHGRGGQVRRVHLIPPDGTFPRRGAPSAACGQPWWETTDAPNECLPFGGPLPHGLTWCPKCLGVAADRLGLADRVAALVVEAVAQ